MTGYDFAYDLERAHGERWGREVYWMPKWSTMKRKMNDARSIHQLLTKGHEYGDGE